MVKSLNELRRTFLAEELQTDIPPRDIETAENLWLSKLTGLDYNLPKPDLLRALFQSEDALRWDDYLRALGFSGARETMMREFYSRVMALNLPLTSNIDSYLPTVKINEFDGVDDYVSISDFLSVENEYTIEAKIKTTSSSTRRIVSQGYYGGSANAGLFFRVDSGVLNFAPQGSTAVTGSILVNDGEEHIVKCIKTSTTSAVYVDGILDNSVSSSDQAITSTEDFLISSYNSGAGELFEGNIDYIKVWSDITGTTKILDLDLTSASYGKDQVQDLSGNGNHGTSYGKGEFSRSTDGTCIDNEGVIQTIPIDIARFEGANWDSVNEVFSEYDDDGERISSDTLKGLMSYEGGTNLCLHSEDFSDTDWSAGTSNVLTTNQDTAPDETLTADRLVMPASSATFLRKFGILDINTTYTFSIYVKSAGTDDSFVLIQPDGTSGTLIATDEYIRHSITFTTGASISTNQVGINNGDDSFATDIYIWGAQLEESSFATPYIKTTLTTASTTADIPKQDMTDIITQSIGSINAEFNCVGANDSATPYIFALSDGTTDNYIGLYGDEATQEIIATIVTGGVLQASIITTGDKFTYNVQHKAEVTYEDDNVVFYLDGVKIGEDTSATIPTGLTTLYSGNRNGSNQLNGTTKKASYKSTIDSEAEAIRRTQ